MKEAKAKLKGP